MNFITLICYFDGTTAHYFDGKINGEIIHDLRGDNGFGYDPYFYLKEEACCAAELTPEKKNRISHRGMAMRELVVQLRHAGMLA